MQDDDNYNNQETGPVGKPSLFDEINNYLLLFYALTCFIIYFTLSGMLYISGYITAILILPGIVAIVLPLVLLSSRISSSFSETYRLDNPQPAVLGLVILASVCITLPADAIAGFFEQFKANDSDYISFLLAIKPKGFLSFLAVAFGIVIVAPFSEELLFRGFIQRIMQRNMSAKLAVLLSGLLFGLAHFDLTLMPATALIGIFFGYLFVKTGNLFYPFSAHAAYNLISLLRLHFSSEADLKKESVYSPPWLWVAVSVGLLIYLVYLLENQPEERSSGKEDGTL
ncbi:MAG: CPBP family intramembrane metalloprotease [Candidatus Latescibacteria bacterium]|nr:CPBP family intramembrane metalloprotease [bacterium]MBD3423710.1 CPBP family intramembrane metalloprotease [Candidatus Latescibacterota bacterium]